MQLKIILIVSGSKGPLPKVITAVANVEAAKAQILEWVMRLGVDRARSFLTDEEGRVQRLMYSSDRGFY